jgi:hypothetical protein
MRIDAAWSSLLLVQLTAAGMVREAVGDGNVLDRGPAAMRPGMQAHELADLIGQVGVDLDAARAGQLGVDREAVGSSVPRSSPLTRHLGNQT